MMFKKFLCWLFGFRCQAKKSNSIELEVLGANGMHSWTGEVNGGGKHSRRKTRRKKIRS